MRKDKLEQLASERSTPCVTISMNTPHIFPNNRQDISVLENLLKEAREHVVNEFGCYAVNHLLDKIDKLLHDMDFTYNLKSLHIFLSDSTTEIFKLSWPVLNNNVAVAESFLIRPLIKDFNQFIEYLVLEISPVEIRLFRAINDRISGEIKNADFNFDSHACFLIGSALNHDSTETELQLADLFGRIDTAVSKIHDKTGMNLVVICSDDNWIRLKKVADKPAIYLGTVNSLFNNVVSHSFAIEAFKIVAELQETGCDKAIHQMREANGQGKVITDLHDIFVAAKEGRGDLLIVRDDYHQPVKMTGENSFDMVSDVTQPGVIDDITSDIAWEVISKKGRAIFTNPKEYNPLGNIALRLRY